MMDDKARYEEGVGKDWMREGAAYTGGVELVSGIGAAKEVPMRLLSRRAALKKAAQWEPPGALAAETAPAMDRTVLDDVISGSDWEPGKRTGRPGSAPDDGKTFGFDAGDAIVPEKAKQQWKPPQDNKPSDTVAIPKAAKTPQDELGDIIAEARRRSRGAEGDNYDPDYEALLSHAEKRLAAGDTREAERLLEQADIDLSRRKETPSKMARDYQDEEAQMWAEYDYERGVDSTGARMRDASDFDQFVKRKAAIKDEMAAVVPAALWAKVSEEDRDEIARAFADAKDLGAETAGELMSFLGKTKSGILLAPAAEKLVEILSTPEGQLAASAGTFPIAMAAAPLSVGGAAAASIPVLGGRMLARLAEDDPQKKVYNSLESQSKTPQGPNKERGPVSKIDKAAFEVLVDTFFTPDFEEAYQRGIISDELFARVADAVEAKQSPKGEAQVAQAEKPDGGPARTEGFKGRGGWGYELLPDGNVRITDAPPEWSDRVGKIAKAGTEAHGAIMAEYREKYGKGRGGAAPKRDSSGDIAHRTGPNGGGKAA